MMNKIVITLCLFAFSFPVFSQTCEQREDELLKTVGSFSAGLLYNTYGTIGSISDGFAHDVYDKETVNELLDAQKKLADNLVKVLEDLKTGGYLKDKSDQDYSASIITILKGLKKQAQLMQDYAKLKTQQKLDDYDTQRKENWKKISQLMGIEE
jgi:hypothetical protein